MLNYKILSFDRNTGTAVINYEGYFPIAFHVPHINGQYLSGQDFETWVQLNFTENMHIWVLDEIDHSSLTNYEYVESKVEASEPFPVTVPYPPSQPE